MKNLNIKFGKSVLIMAVAGLIVSACYEKFDPESYAPQFEISGYSAVSQIEPDHLIAYWAFEESLIDSVSNELGTNHATVFVNGFKNKGVQFNVIDKSYLIFETTDEIKEVESFTISFWMNPEFVDANNTNSIDGIIGLVNISHPSNFWGNIDWFIENGSNNDAATIKVHVNGGAGESWVEVFDRRNLFDGWSNHTLTYDATTSNFIYYINGSNVKTTAAAWTGPIDLSSSGPMVFGAVHFQTTPSLTSATEPQDWASYLTGTMDEVRIYKTALSGIDVNALVVLQGKGK